MDISELQARLTELEHLLPSQREWVERLLFQLAFNDVSYIEAIGTEGSGKSTLALALAELFSEQYNVALISSAIAMPELTNQLMQQWFAVPLQPDISVLQQIEQQSQTKPLLLILDQAISEPAVLSKYIRPLPCLVFNFCVSSMQRDGLTLLLGEPGSADAEQLLVKQQLNPLEITKRLAEANGNLHLLLQPLAANSAARPSVRKVALELPSLRTGYVVCAVAVLLALSYFFWPEPAALHRSEQARNVSTPTSAIDTQADLMSLEPVPAGTTLAGVSTDDSIMSDGVIDSSAASEQFPALSEPLIEPAEQAIGHSVFDNADSASIEPGVAVSAERSDEAPQHRFDEAVLMTIDSQQVALQLAVLSNEQALLRFKAVYPEIAPLVYQRNWQGKPQLVLLLAPFSSNIEAKQKLATLPGALRQSGPFVKRMQSVQAEIGAKALSQQSVME